MTRRRRARLIAIAVVVSATLVSIAHGSFIINHTPATTLEAPYSTAMRIVFSVRNPSAGSQTITMVQPFVDPNCPASVQITPLPGVSIPYSIPPYDQLQFVVSSTGFTASDPAVPQCVYNIYSSDTGIQQLTATFAVNPSSTQLWDVQPKRNDFGSQAANGSSETQYALINNYSPSVGTIMGIQVIQTSGPLNSLAFTSPCVGTSCPGLFGVPAQEKMQVEITCDPTGSGAITGQFLVFGTMGLVSNTDLDCQGTASGGMIDIIPALVSLMGTQGVPVSTGVMITSNPSGNSIQSATITGPDRFSFTFINSINCAAQSCTFAPPTMLDTSLDIQCTPSAMPRSATLTVQGTNGGSDTDTAMLSCSTLGGPAMINIVPALVTLSGTQGVPISTGVMISSNPLGDSIQSATISGFDPTAFTIINNAMCSGQSCTFSPAQQLDIALDIQCTPSATPRNATLVVQGINGGSDTDTAMLSCMGTGGGGPSIFVSPLSVNATTTPVGGMDGPYQITVSNTALTGPNLVADVLLSDPINWTADNCVTSTCSIPPNTSMFVNVRFTPTSVGPLNSILTIDSNAGMPTVMLFGTGGTTQTRLDVEDPTAPFELSFGPLALNQASSQMVRVHATGPNGVMVSAGTPGGVYTVSPSGFIPLAPDGIGFFTVTCQSPTASGPNLANLTITSDADVQNTTMIALDCTIANTNVQVTPTSFAFQEVRVGSGERRLPFTIHNGGSNVMIDFVRVAPMRPGLSVTSILAQVLPSGADLSGDVIVMPDQEVNLDGAFLEVGIAGEPIRQLPITGAVVRPAAIVTPESLDLGTACVGTQISGQVTMSNSGTATLRVEPPMMDQTSFTVSPSTGDIYPLDLAAGSDATIRISPSTSAMGMVTNALSWTADAPGSPFRVPVMMTFVSTGGAVSPNRVAFPALDVFATSSDQKVTLQNCSDVELPLTISGVVPTSGDASAWTVMPRTLQRTLAAKELIEVLVRFNPKSPGEHFARLVIEIGGEDRSVLLEGFAEGERSERVSFYACSCSGPGAPSRGWPIVLAIVVILRRRRR